MRKWSERFGLATKRKSLRVVLDDEVVVDAFDFIYITYDDSSDGGLSRVKTKPIGDTLTDYSNVNNQVK